MSMQMMQVPTTTTTTTTLPSFAAAAGMANNPDVTTGEGALSRLDGSDEAVGKAKGQNVADGDYDGVVVKVGLKFGRNSVVWGGNCKTSTKTTMSSSSSAAASVQYDEHNEYGDEHGDEHHDIVGVGPGPSPGIGVVNLARSNTLTDNTTMEKKKKKDGPVVKNTILLRGSSKPLACCVM